MTVGGTSHPVACDEWAPYVMKTQEEKELTPLRDGACRVPPSVLRAQGRASLMLCNSYLVLPEVNKVLTEYL